MTPRDPLGLAGAVAREVAAVPGIVAVVLGGSYARGDARPGSDVDLGLYYRGSAGFDLAALRAAAARLDPRPEAVPTEPGGWGPRIDGGAWLQVQRQALDLVYRDVERVGAAIDRALSGRISLEHQPGHPAGFHSQVYLAELALARPLVDPDGIVGRLRRRITPYPEPLRAAILATAWEAGFAVETGRKAAARADLFATSGALFNGVACLVFVLHALNRTWLMNEKGAVDAIERMPLRPAEFRGRVDRALGGSDTSVAGLESRLDVLAGLAGDVGALIARG